MGIPRKGSRKLVVDGGYYRYLVKQTTIPGEPDQKENSVTIQEDADKPGRVLQFRYPYYAEVTPQLLQDAVRKARQQGWNPAERGNAFQMEVL